MKCAVQVFGSFFGLDCLFFETSKLNAQISFIDGGYLGLFAGKFTCKNRGFIANFDRKFHKNNFLRVF